MMEYLGLASHAATSNNPKVPWRIWEGSQLELVVQVNDRPNERLTNDATPNSPNPLRLTTKPSQPTTTTITTKMAPRKISTNPSPSAIPPSSTKATTVVPSSAGQPTRSANKPASSSSGQVRSAQDLQEIGVGIWNKYVDETPQRVKLLDAFLVFLIVVGVLQFAYCVIAGNFVSIILCFEFLGRDVGGDIGSRAIGFGD
jgi:hypothetical protein